VKIAAVHTLIGCGPYATSRHWRQIRREIHDAVRSCEWPPGSGSFTIYPQSGKKRGEGNGVKPIRDRFVADLRRRGWVIEGPSQNRLGRFDAVLPGPKGPVAVEWETSDIASSHHWMNKLAMLLASESIAAGILVVPSRAMCPYLAGRIGNIEQLEPYFAIWRSFPCRQGVLEVIVVEHDATSEDVPRIPRRGVGRPLG